MGFALFVLKLVIVVIAPGFPYQEELIGDLLEEWLAKLTELGPAEARRWLWGQVLRSIGAILRWRLERAIETCEQVLRSMGAMLRWRLERAIEKLQPEALVVWMVQIALLLYLLPVILTIALLHVIFISIYIIDEKLSFINNICNM